MKKFVLHIGPMKTSSTYIQSILKQNRKLLATEGWVYPGNGANQERALFGLLGKDVPWVGPGLQAEHYDAGQNLVKNIKGAEENIILSAEAIAVLTNSGIENMLRTIGMPSRIIVMHRPLEKLIPSAWQHLLKKGSTATLDEFAIRFFSENKDKDGTMYRMYAVGDIVERWKNITGSRIAVVKVPTRKQDASLLWPMFQQACGLPGVEMPTSTEGNLSLSAEAADLLIRFNTTMKNKGLFSTELLHAFVNNVLLDKRFGETRISLEGAHVDEANILEREQVLKATTLADEVFEV